MCFTVQLSMFCLLFSVPHGQLNQFTIAFQVCQRLFDEFQNIFQIPAVTSFASIADNRLWVVMKVSTGLTVICLASPSKGLVNDSS